MIDTIEVQSRSRANMTHTLYTHEGKAVGCTCEYRQHHPWTPCPHMTEYNSRIPEDDIIVHIEDELRGSCCLCGYPTKGVICWRCLG